ncbi:protoporphyrinogen oxidase domain protein [Mycobacterium ulcerans str. Harvey]|uniref:Protoporphyrinogen oxidase domain protein n=1 Tax=Mycobacterium ulcerans str. Harvey TaxID=1299332 RepID=A0ABN0R0N2_MYCUL|nr:protoporphyrinogen oxidase domain protein [Mycobacterium ulcerans str. Harvey]
MDDACDLLDASGASSALNNAITNTGAQVKREIRYADYYATIADGDGLPTRPVTCRSALNTLPCGGHIGLRPGRRAMVGVLLLRVT